MRADDWDQAQEWARGMESGKGWAPGRLLAGREAGWLPQGAKEKMGFSSWENNGGIVLDVLCGMILHESWVLSCRMKGGHAFPIFPSFTQPFHKKEQAPRLY